MDPETAETCNWVFEYAVDFLHCIHPKYGYYTQFPCDGGYYDQPFRLMQIYDCMKGVFIDLINSKK